MFAFIVFASIHQIKKTLKEGSNILQHFMRTFRTFYFISPHIFNCLFYFIYLHFFLHNKKFLTKFKKIILIKFSVLKFNLLRREIAHGKKKASQKQQ